MTTEPTPEAAVLVGGRGTRLAAVVGDRPKPMAEVAGRPFLEWVLLGLRREGVRRVVLCSGYRGSQISEHFGDGSRWGLSLAYSREEQPLGTGGALRNALPLLGSDPFLALNGDSWCRFDLSLMMRTHRERGALATLWLARAPDAGRYGAVTLGADGAVTAFAEKGGTGPGLINAGVYLLSRPPLQERPAGVPFSIETDFFPSLVSRGLCGAGGDGGVLDIGTPESYREASAALAGEFASLAAHATARSEA
jgi:NDP-sugar pyrophosphorylase family protein